VSLYLPDGRVVVAARPRAGLRHFGALAVTLGLVALAVAVGAWPLVRRLTRRLENLRRRVEDLGRGDLAARAPVEGRDEVADLARSFNRAADRIQALVEAQRRQLAFASHELRSPLARLRVSLEMMAGDPALKERAARDVAELDGLIDELLEASRLEAQRGLARVEDVDVLALAAEEAARAGAEAEGEAVLVRGDVRLLRRLVRNLLDNAQRHGGGGAVEARVDRLAGGGARLSVLDRGPGVPESERERVFEPFHRPPGAPETGSGYGLGLALVRQIALAHGGDARCLARDGGGTVLEVDLPGAR
jgi:signal transduction histidine kinase